MKKTLLAAMIVLIVASSAHANSPIKDAARVGRPCPSFLATTIEGESVKSEELQKKSRAVLLNFWGIRCSSCLAEIPFLNALHRKFGGDLAVIGVNVDGVDGGFLKDAVKDIGVPIEYIIVPDPEFKLVDLFKMTAAPLTILVDSLGVIRYVHEDYKPGDEKEIEDAVRAVITANTPSGGK